MSIISDPQIFSLHKGKIESMFATLPFIVCTCRFQVLKEVNKPDMSSSPKCFALAQITSLVGSISKKNYRANCSEIAKVCVQLILLSRVHAITVGFGLEMLLSSNS